YIAALHSVPTRRSSDLEIGDYVWVDYNGNGLQDEGEPVVPDVKVYLLNELGQVVDSTLTNSEGRYFFYPRLGTFQVRFVIPDGQDRKSTRLNSSHVKIS